MRTHTIIYAIFIASILLDLATAAVCFQLGDLTETNSVYQKVGLWAFPLVLLFDAGVLLIVEWLRKHTRWSPIILLIPILAYAMACVINLLILL